MLFVWWLVAAAAAASRSTGGSGPLLLWEAVRGCTRTGVLEAEGYESWMPIELNASSDTLLQWGYSPLKKELSASRFSVGERGRLKGNGEGSSTCLGLYLIQLRYLDELIVLYSRKPHISSLSTAWNEGQAITRDTHSSEVFEVWKKASLLQSLPLICSPLIDQSRQRRIPHRPVWYSYIKQDIHGTNRPSTESDEPPL